MNGKNKTDVNLIIVIAIALIIGAIAFVFYKYETYHQLPLFKIIS